MVYWKEGAGPSISLFGCGRREKSGGVVVVHWREVAGSGVELIVLWNEMRMFFVE